MSSLKIPTIHGDDLHEWELSDKEATRIAEQAFVKATKNGLAGFLLHKNGDGKLIREFDPTAETIVFALPLAGG